MNTAMLNATATQENITILQRRNMTVLPTESGTLACGAVGAGRLLPSEEIALFARRSVTKPSLAGKKFSLLWEETEEAIDPVRVLTNKSSGKMGLSLATEAFFSVERMSRLLEKPMSTFLLFLITLFLWNRQKKCSKDGTEYHGTKYCHFCACCFRFFSKEKSLEKIASQKRIATDSFP